MFKRWEVGGPLANEEGGSANEGRHTGDEWRGRQKQGFARSVCRGTIVCQLQAELMTSSRGGYAAQEVHINLEVT